MLAIATLVTLGSLSGTPAARAAATPAVPEPPTARAGSDETSFVTAAQAAGGATVRVIAQLAIDTFPEDQLTGAGVGAQRRAIAQRQRVVTAALTGSGARVRRSFNTVAALAIEAPASGIDRLASLPEVRSVAVETPSRASLMDSGPLVGADTVQAAGYDGTGWNVAVLDTGVDRTHPFLANRVVDEACFSIRASCPNGQTTMTGPGSGMPCTFLPGTCQHGTHVAGIAAGNGTTGSVAYSGMAPGAGVLAIDVFSNETTAFFCPGGVTPCDVAWPSDQIAGLERVYALRSTFRVAAVNMSIGGLVYTTQAGCDTLIPGETQIIANLRGAGIATVIASGNDSSSTGVAWPGCISSAISVGSTTKADAISSFSNSAAFLSILAPGSSITSSIPGGAYGVKSGTSMATPHVAGAVALMRQRYPAASVDTVLSTLQTTGVPILDSRNNVTKSRIALAAALGNPSGPPAGSRFNALAAASRVLDSRDGTGTTAAPFGPGETRTIQLPNGLVPPDATAIAINLTGFAATTGTYVTAWQTGTAMPGTASLLAGPNLPLGQFTIVAIDAQQRFELFVAAGTLELMGDVVGWYAPTGSLYQPQVLRIADTRSGQGVVAPGAMGAADTRTITLPAGTVPAGGGAALLTITATNTSTYSFLTAYATNDPLPLAAALNPAPGRHVGNTAVVPVDAGGKFTIYNSAGSTDVVIDVQGFFRPVGGTYLPVTPTRVADSRIGLGTPDAFGAGSDRTITIGPGVVPAGAGAAVIMITGYLPNTPTYLTVHPTGTAVPATATVVVVPGDATMAFAIVPIDQLRRFAVFNQLGSMHVIIDVVGAIP